jgi:hypothetical protein
MSVPTLTYTGSVPAAPAPLNGHLRDTAEPTPGELGAGWLAVVIAVGIMASAIALGGMMLSFRAVSVEMRPAFGTWSVLVPVVIDLSVFVFSGVDLVLARLDMPHPLARWTVYGATFGTVYLNYSAGGDLPGRVAHVLMPSIWVIFIELMRHIVRRKVNLATGARREPIPAARWFLAPWPTTKLWRRMVLWRVNSYTAALAAERRRLAALAVVRAEHGRLWRSKVSPLLRMQIAMGELGAENVRTLMNPGHTDGQSPATTAATPGQSGDQSTAKPAAIKRPSRGQSTAEKVAKATAVHPEWSAAEMAAKLGIGERTARRYMTGK